MGEPLIFDIILSPRQSISGRWTSPYSESRCAANSRSSPVLILSLPVSAMSCS